MNKENCLTTEIKHAYLFDKLSTDERETAEAHLAACRLCRHQLTVMFEDKQEVLSIPDLLKQKAKQIPAQEIKERQNLFTSLSAYFRQPVAVAASIVLLIVVSSITFFVLREKSPAQNSNEEKLRQGNTSANKPQILSPAINAQITSDQIEFRWEKVINALSYTLIVTDEKGDIIFQQKTTQENFTLNLSTLNLTKDKTYFWFVKTKLADGTAIDSDTAKFHFVK